LQSFQLCLKFAFIGGNCCYSLTNGCVGATVNKWAAMGRQEYYLFYKTVV